MVSNYAERRQPLGQWMCVFFTLDKKPTQLPIVLDTRRIVDNCALNLAEKNAHPLSERLVTLGIMGSGLGAPLSSSIRLSTVMLREVLEGPSIGPPYTYDRCRFDYERLDLLDY